MGSDALNDLVLQTGPIGGLIVLLGGLVRGWLREIKDELKALAVSRDATKLELTMLTMRVTQVEGRVDRVEQSAAPTVRERIVLAHKPESEAPP